MAPRTSRTGGAVLAAATPEEQLPAPEPELAEVPAVLLPNGASVVVQGLLAAQPALQVPRARSQASTTPNVCKHEFCRHYMRSV